MWFRAAVPDHRTVSKHNAIAFDPGFGLRSGPYAGKNPCPAQNCKGPGQARHHGAHRARESENSCNRGHQKFNESNAKPHATPNTNPNRVASKSSTQHCRASKGEFRLQAVDSVIKRSGRPRSSPSTPTRDLRLHRKRPTSTNNAFTNSDYVGLRRYLGTVFPSLELHNIESP